MKGKTINGYTLQRPLGTGGMAEVWLAENAIGKKAAVKLLLPKFCDDEDVVARFENEAKVMVKLEHPNIRQVYDYTILDGRPCIIMEYLEGDDLKSLMKQGRRFTQEELVKWWNQMVLALNYTHEIGVIHRDIKPSNIFIDKYNNVRLLDFGIAKNYDNEAQTRTGATMGTLLYMSPEQVKDPKRVGCKSDVYSLAVTFVHLVSNKAPYDSTISSNFDIQMDIVHKPLDLSAVPPMWRTFLEPYLEKEPLKRIPLKLWETTYADKTNDNDKLVEDNAYTPSTFERTIRKLLLGKNDWTEEELQCQYDNSAELESALKEIQIQKERIMVLPSGYNFLQRRKEKERIYASRMNNELLSIRCCISYPEAIAMALMTSELSDEMVNMMIVVHKNDFMDIAVIEYECGVYVASYTDYLSSVNMGKAYLAIRRAKQEIATFEIERIDKLLLVSDNPMDLEYKELIESVFGMKAETRKDLQLLVNQGVAIQAGVYAGCVKDVLRLSVLSQTIGVEKDDGLMMPLVYADTTIPTRRSDNLLLDAAKAWFVVDIWQGNDKIARNNANIATLRMKNPYLEKGKKHNVEITVDIDSKDVCTIIMEDKDYDERVEFVI